MSSMYPFKITAVLHSSVTFASGKNDDFSEKIVTSYTHSIVLQHHMMRKVIIATHKCPGWMQDRSYRERVYSVYLLIKICYNRIYCCDWTDMVLWFKYTSCKTNNLIGCSNRQSKDMCNIWRKTSNTPKNTTQKTKKDQQHGPRQRTGGADEG